MKKFAAAMLTLAALFLFGAIFLRIQSDKNAESAALTALTEEASQLEREKEKLSMELYRQERDYTAKLHYQATEEIIFRTLDERLYSTAYPLVKKCGGVGVLTVTDTEFPGDPGCITMEQFQELCEKGWTVTARCTDFAEPESWYQRLKERLEATELDMPDSVFLDCEYEEALNQKLQDLGFFTIIFRGEYDSEFLYEEPTDDHWTLGAYQWNFSGIRTDLDAMMAQGVNRAFTVSFDSDARDCFYKQNFQNMVYFCYNYWKNNQMKSTGFSEAAEYRRSKAKENIPIQKEMEEVLSALQAKKDDIQSQLNEIYSRSTY